MCTILKKHSYIDIHLYRERNKFLLQMCKFVTFVSANQLIQQSGYVCNKHIISLCE